MKKKRWKATFVVVLFLLCLCIEAFNENCFWQKIYLTKSFNIVEAANNTEISAEGYYYRKDVVNILCLGIDRYQNYDGEERGGTSRGQADCIMLLSLDLSNDVIRVVAIPRDTMVEIKFYDTSGYYMTSQQGQLTLQYAYVEDDISAAVMESQVSMLLGGIPIHGYVILDLTCIPIVNDVIGGVPVTMQEDYTDLNETFVEGETVWLYDDMVADFIQKRDTSVSGSAYTRIARQKAYLASFVEQAKKVLPQNPKLPLQILKELQTHIETDLDAAEILALVDVGRNSEFAESDLYVLPGEIKMGEVYEEYYIKEEEAYVLISQLFYEE
jgi:LCP family protein required for cell wall assembly